MIRNSRQKNLPGICQGTVNRTFEDHFLPQKMIFCVQHHTEQLLLFLMAQLFHVVFCDCFRLAERKSLHGVLVDIYSLGVLITGDSGVGKSETALDLIKRGHRLIADDRVEVYQQDEQTLVGEAPAILRHMLEIRGVGIIDVMNLFGAGAVRSKTDISLIIHLENWDKDKKFDRLGNGEQKVRIFDVEIPKITIPVKVGRNLAIIIEAAAMNFRAKTMGYDATKAFEDNLNALIQQNSVN